MNTTNSNTSGIEYGQRVNQGKVMERICRECESEYVTIELQPELVDKWSSGGLCPDCREPFDIDMERIVGGNSIVKQAIHRPLMEYGPLSHG